LRFGHRRRPGLAGAERLGQLADLGVLEVAHLRGDALERPAGDGESRQERGVAIARDDLCRGRLRR